MSENQQVESTLTAPHDRNLENKFTFSKLPPLDEEQTVKALEELNTKDFVMKFPRVERAFADPTLDLQRIGLISFIPAKGAKPDEKGVFGFAKLRGNFQTMAEADQRAEFLVQNHDSYHKIYHTYVGRPFPITLSSDYSKEVKEVDLQKDIKEANSDVVKKMREKEQKDIEEIQKKEEELLEDVKKIEEPTEDVYTTLRVKKAQLTWTYSETEKKLKQMRTLIANARKEIEDLEAKDSSLKHIYLKKYIDARKKAGLSTTITSKDETFMKYLVEDLKLPEVDKEYERLYGKNNKSL
jgi:hypothetical protein